MELRELDFAYDERVNGSKKTPKQKVNVNASINLSGNDLFALAEHRKLTEMEQAEIVEV